MTGTGAPLTACFEADGYAVVRGALEEAELATIRESLDATAGDTWRRPAVPHPVLPTTNREVSLSVLMESDSAVRRLLTCGAVGRLVAELAGPCRMRLWQLRCVVKDPWAAATSLHADSPYLPFDHVLALTCWIPLQPVVPANGALVYLRGSHRLDHRGLSTSSGPTELRYVNEIFRFVPGLEESEPVAVRAEPGDVLVHDAALVHGAHPNLTSGTRTALGAAYVDAAATFRAQGRSGFLSGEVTVGARPDDRIFPVVEAEHEKGLIGCDTPTTRPSS